MRSFIRGASARGLASSLWILAAILFATCGSARGFELSSSQKRDMLSPREKNFLTFVFSGDEAKAVEYAQAAGVNPNAIGGEPLSTWFYGLGPVANINVQHTVFERFRQNANPTHVGDMEFIGGFCNMGPVPDNIRVAVQGSPDEKAALQQRQESARRAYANTIVASFQSLLGYGLKDRTILTRIFVGCLSNRATQRTAEYYDMVLAPMLKAGAKIDGDDSYGSLLHAVQEGNPLFVERFVADGADVIYHLQTPNRWPYGQGPCQPRADQSLYRYVFDLARPGNEESALRIIKALATKGLSPTAKWGFGDLGGCKYTTLYDAVLDTGNMAYATRIKEIGETIGKTAALPATAPTAKTTPQVSQPPMPSQFGAWKVAIENGKSVARADVDKPGGHLTGIRLECASGHLEYVPLASQVPVKTLWVNGMDDNTLTIPLANGRVAGADNASLSKEFLGSEANYKRNGTTTWGIEMSVDGPDGPSQSIVMTGFSQMRSYMLANCKKQERP